ncbi:uncharacterized protein LOC114228044 [Eptesicus fuscus]|uniref:uncharacterized protein LOC114228044 n=1 Tax=Eptesicus fuscus TaxID=29078 RepID=UPI0024047B91|nr:uncharacterized protein LOC114228044 [Eptesicus fuscus]
MASSLRRRLRRRQQLRGVPARSPPPPARLPPAAPDPSAHARRRPPTAAIGSARFLGTPPFSPPKRPHRLAGDETFGWKQLLCAPQCGPLRADLGGILARCPGQNYWCSDLEIRASPLENAQDSVLLNSGCTANRIEAHLILKILSPSTVMELLPCTRYLVANTTDTDHECSIHEQDLQPNLFPKRKSKRALETRKTCLVLVAESRGYLVANTTDTDALTWN